ncbi:hypothetical protein DRH27_05890 [Candidatus Falkowbacteria bacterium]|nr:MAG: hypothetical protein DRH27_05890 [Candidatus Falkowbacteria bacterium]
MDYYEKKRRAGIDLMNWVNNKRRSPFSIFCLNTLKNYGFDNKSMLRLLENTYPDFTIVDDKLKEVEAGKVKK